MRPVSSAFLTAVPGSHSAVFRARIVNPGSTGTNPGPVDGSGSPVNTIKIVGGDVTFSTSSDVNGTCEIHTDMAWPMNSAALGSPYGQELFLERGIRFGSGTQEWVGLGYFRIGEVAQDDAPKGVIRISGEDRMSGVRDARPIAPVQFVAGSSVGTIIDQVVGACFSWAVTTVYPDWDVYNTPLVSDHVLNDDNISFLNELITSFGRIYYWDYKGRFVVKKIPSLTTQAVTTINAGRYGVLCSMQRTISRDSVYNAVVATGEPVDEQPPVRGVAFDLNPASPTYWNGAFGHVPKFFSSSFLTSIDQCDSAAASLLAGLTGVPYVVSLGTVPNPALEGWDVIVITYADSQPSEVHIIDTITYPLTVEEEMALSTRKTYLN